MQVTLTVVAGPHQGREFAFDARDNFIVGRGKQAHFRLPKADEYFSRLHFMVEVNPPLCRLYDLKSTNGTLVNRQTATEPIELADGDMIEGGDTLIRVSIREAVSRRADEQPGAAPLARARASHAASLADDCVGGRFAITGGLTPPRSPESICTPRAAGKSPTTDDEPIYFEEAPSEAETFHQTRFPETAKSGSTASCNPALIPTIVSEPLDLSREASGSDLPADFEDLIRQQPQPIPGYFIVDVLGEGGMGIVYRAMRQSDRSVVALKCIKPRVKGSEADIARFRREGRILSELRHPRIVRFLEQGDANGQLFFAMDYICGTDASCISSRTSEPLNVERVIGWGTQMLDALGHAHARGFVHRDVKPSNLLITQVDGEEIVILTDFGLARTYQNSTLSGLSRAGDLGGTMNFMAPEQITDFRGAQSAVDQYAAAATIYSLLTRRCVYDLPKSLNGQVLMILQDDPVSIRLRRSDVSSKLSATLHRALARDPAQRFESVHDFRSELLASLP